VCGYGPPFAADAASAGRAQRLRRISPLEELAAAIPKIAGPRSFAEQSTPVRAEQAIPGRYSIQRPDKTAAVAKTTAEFGGGGK